MKTITNAKELKKIIMDLEGINLKDEDCEMITGYFEGHDYEIKADESNLFIVDALDEMDVFEICFEGIMDRVYEWNMELIKETKREINSIEIDKYQLVEGLSNYLLQLQRDSINLNKLEVALNLK